MDVFISHVAEDARVALAIALGLEDAGYSTWCFEVDSVPGVSYLVQIGEAIERASAVVLVISSLALHSRQVTIEVVRASHLQGVNLYPQCPACGLRLFEDNSGIRIGRIPKHSHTRESGKQFLEQFQALPTEVRHHQAHACDVATGSRQAVDEPSAQRVAG